MTMVISAGSPIVQIVIPLPPAATFLGGIYQACAGMSLGICLGGG